MERVRDQLLEGARAMPRAVPVVVATGLLLSLAAFALNRGGWEASAELEWMTVEEIAPPPPARIDGGGDARKRPKSGRGAVFARRPY